MKAEDNYELIASRCRVFLASYGHPSRRARTDEVVAELHEATRPVGAPLDLSIAISERIGTGETVGG